MKNTSIEFNFDDAKLEAINIYLKEKNSKLSEELDHFMDSLYKKYVPQAVREFIDKKESEGRTSPPSPSKPTRRKPNSIINAESGTEGIPQATSRGDAKKADVDDCEGS
jgi:hypothetical protein